MVLPVFIVAPALPVEAASHTRGVIVLSCASSDGYEIRGSGVSINRDQLAISMRRGQSGVITATHVIRDCVPDSIRVLHGSQSLRARVLVSNDATDAALLVVGGRIPSRYVSMELVMPGDPVVVAGAAAPGPVVAEQGLVTAVTGPTIEVATGSLDGQSGGAIFNPASHMIGLIYAGDQTKSLAVRVPEFCAQMFKPRICTSRSS